jgi:phosphosulfolactate synthase (CoM biosynthesis protein A)
LGSEVRVNGVFNDVAIPARPPKPRTSGINAIIDRGPDIGGWMTLSGTDEFLEVAAPFVDYAKIYAAHPLMLPADWIAAKIAIYERRDVRVYSGGILMEIAYLQGRLPAFYDGVKRLGFRSIEISENYLTLTTQDRLRLIAEARDRGFEVLFEFGSKHPERPLSAQEAVDAIGPLVEAGAMHVIIEQAEIDQWRASDPGTPAVVAAGIGARHVLWEVDPNLFPAHHLWLMQVIGAEANLGNIHPDQLLRIEEFRRGLGRAIGFPFVANGARVD